MACICMPCQQLRVSLQRLGSLFLKLFSLCMNAERQKSILAYRNDKLQSLLS